MKIKVLIIFLLLILTEKVFSHEDYYKILNVPSNASAEEIKSAYRKLAMKYHPDRNGGSSVSTEIFKKVNVAYSILSDPAKRAKFDSAFRFSGRSSGNATGNTNNNYKSSAHAKAQPFKTEKYDWQDFGEQPRPSTGPKPDPSAETKAGPKPSPKPEPKVEATIRPTSSPAAGTSPIKPLTDSPYAPKNPKLNLYNTPSCNKGFLGTVIDILI